MTFTVARRHRPWLSTFRADIAAIYAELGPDTVGCFEVPELTSVPLEAFVRGGAHVWFIDWQAGRVRDQLERALVRNCPTTQICLACDTGAGDEVCATYVARGDGSSRCERLTSTSDHGHCTQFAPGRRIHVVTGDGDGGRRTGFATRIEGVVATAATPSAAVDAAIDLCERSTQLNIPLPIPDGSLDLVISVLVPSRLMEQPYALFDELLKRRFRARAQLAQTKLVHKLRDLQLTLFRSQLDAHVREVARLTSATHGRLYFATVPAEVATDGAWCIEPGVTECFEALTRYFSFDFDTFPPEAFLRRPPDDRTVVLQAALLRHKPTEGAIT